MTVSLEECAIMLRGTCGVEEVEVLVNALERCPGLPVDLSAATAIHTALWQALMVFRPKMTGSPASSPELDRTLAGLNVYFADGQES